MNKKILFFLIVIIFLVCGNISHAGFGISPPYVKTSKPIFPGSHFEQKITLLRSSAASGMQSKIVINAPEIESWISIKGGNEFDIPKDKLQIPMIVQVDVPEDAEVGNYKGYINIKILPKQGNKSGVAIALGARVDINLDITDETFLEFLVRKVDIPAIEKLKKPWNWKIFSWLLYRVNVAMKIENTGNVKIAPTKVHLDIYDISEKKLLESYDDKSIKKVEPFETKTVVASFPTKLPKGQYWGKVRIYNDNEIIFKNKMIFDIYEAGKLPGGAKLGSKPWIILSVYILSILIIILSLIKIKSWRYVFKFFFIISWPLRFVFKKINFVIKKLKIKFWRWIHRKSAKYQNKDEDKTE